MMGKQETSAEEEIIADINMTPFIDIMLVLLIIFMVTSSISPGSELDVELPVAKESIGNKGNSPESAVIVTLLRDGSSAVQGRPVVPDKLESAIKEALVGQNTSLVILEGDRLSELGSAVSVMDVARRAGAAKIAIATTDK